MLHVSHASQLTKQKNVWSRNNTPVPHAGDEAWPNLAGHAWWP